VHTVVEAPEYLKASARAGMSDEEREDVVEFISANPEAGTVLDGGIRKVRVPGKGREAETRTAMKKSDFESLQRSLGEVDQYRAGKRAGFVVHEPVDVRKVRARTKLTRTRFAERFGLDSRTVEQWEQGRRKPDKSSETYLRLIEKAPDAVADLVARL
jgi:putative transcriptional regulator